MLNFIKKNRKILGMVFMITVGFFVATTVSAQETSSWLDPIKNGAVLAVGWIIKLWVSLLGKLCLQFVAIIISLAQYNGFVTSSAVTNGWVIIRDVVNMFFILILLVIAFATIFNVREYKYQAMLPRLLIMAVVINFSRTICGIFIDLGQVVMLTFVNGFQAAAGGNFIKALKIEELMKFDATQPSPDLLMIVGSFMLAAIMITVTAVVLGAFVLMLVMRVVTLWFLVILSPLAFMASVWPSGRISQKYGEWWSMFLDNIIAGPILAFFLWLSLLVLGNGDVAKIDDLAKSTYEQESQGGTQLNVSGTQIGTLDNMISYLMGIGMLLGSLYMTQSMKSAGGGIAGKALGAVQGYAKGAVMKPISLVSRGAKTVAREGTEGLYRVSGLKENVDLAKTNLQASWLGKTFKPTESQKQERDIKYQIRALKSTGVESDASKAEQLQNTLAAKKQKSLEDEGVNVRVARQRLKTAKKGGAEEEALANIIAASGTMKHGEFNAYGVGRDDREAKRIEYRLRSAASKSGDKTAFWGYSEDPAIPGDAKKDIEETFKQHKTPGEQQTAVKDLLEWSKLGADGKINNKFAPEVLGSIDSAFFAKFTPKRQQEILDAAVLMKKNSPDKFDAKLEEKVNDLIEASSQEKNSPFTAMRITDFAGYETAKKDVLVQREGEEVAGRKAGAYRTGILEKNDVDRNLESIVQDTGAGWQKDRMNDSLRMLNDIATMKTSADATKVIGELQAIQKELKDEVARRDLNPATAKTGQFDSDGQEMTNVKVLEGSKLFNNLADAEGMAKDMEINGVDDKKKKAAAQLAGIGTRYMEDATGMRPPKEQKTGVYSPLVAHPKNFYGTVKDYYTAEATARNNFAKVPEIADASKRVKQLKLSLNQLSTALRIVEKNKERFSSEILSDINQLNQAIENIGQKGAEVGKTEIDNLNTKLDEVRAKIIAT